MKHPDNPILNRLDAAISALHEAEKVLADAKERLGAEARAISNLSDKQERADLAIYAYWHMPEIAVSDLAFGATGKDHPAHLHKLMGPVAVGIQCECCGGQVPVTSRSQVKDMQDRLRLNGPRWAEGYRVLCPGCELKILADRRAKDEARDAANQKRYAQLHAMPYAEYLRTTEWAKSLQDHVDFARWEAKSNLLTCEACGHEEATGAYHKRTERLGHEWSDDLILLGASCLQIFTSNGLIFGEPAQEHLIRNCRLSNYEDYGCPPPTCA